MARYKIHALDDPSAPPGSIPLTPYNWAYGLNNFGMVVGVAAFAEVSLGRSRAVFWNPNPTVIPAGDVFSHAFGVNDAGDIVGQRDHAFGGGILNEAFLFRGGQCQGLASVFPAEESVAVDINNAGVIAAWAGESGWTHAFTFDINSGILTDLGVLPGHTVSFASAINNAGHVVGVSTATGDSRAFLFDGTLKDLGPALSANDINDSGQVVGSRDVSGVPGKAFRCDTSGGTPQFVDLEGLPGSYGSEAWAINNDGDIVGQLFYTSGNRPFIWPAGRPMQDLNKLIPANSGWELHHASAINNRGQIAGTGTHNGREQAYLLTPIPVIFPPTRPSYQIDEAAIDPMRIILGEKWYLIWVEAHHPHVPILSSLAVVLRQMPMTERQAARERAKRLGDFSKRIESLIEQMMDGR
jgi:probable HAF family extracellular repeat protein